jgi:3-oxoacyl-[acyl-carrier protein] reductase
MSLQGHIALITGAGQGIGKACAFAFAAKGAELIIWDKNPETIGEVAHELKQMGCKAADHVVDLTDIEELRHAAREAQKTGLIDILVNNAGFDRPGTTDTIDKTGFEEVMAIHVTVPLLLIQMLLPDMRRAGWGRIINVSSVYGAIGGKGEVAYSTAKAGIIGLTKSVAKECGKYGVTVNAVLPGLTRTPTIETVMSEKYKRAILADTPLGRMAEPEEVARVLAFLASDDASFITGAALPVSGGWGI